MVPDKRTITAACGLLASAALALAACAPSGYGDGDGDASGGSTAAPQLANATGTPGPSEAPAAENTGNNAEANFTTELKANTIKRMGKVVVNQDGSTLYLFTEDSKNPSKSTCDDTCAKIWPPALTDGNPAVEGVSADLVGTVTRDDGTKQITIGGWPVYTYIGDKKPGAWTGQAVDGTWFVMGPNGKKNITCLPTYTPKPVAPPADDTSTSDSGSDDSGGGYSY